MSRDFNVGKERGRSIRFCEANGLVFFAMVGPKIRSIEGERSRFERDQSDVFRLGFRLTEVDAGEEVFVGSFVVCSGEVEYVADEDLSADSVGEA